MSVAGEVAYRIGHGWDLHRLAAVGEGQMEGVVGVRRPMVVGGVAIESEVGPVGHSDGDVLLHALTDALLGAVGLPDIGQLFPDDSKVNEGRDSAEFVAEAMRWVGKMGWEVVNVDSTVVLEGTKIGPRKERMRERMAELLCVEPGAVNIKGKSHEKVDAVGRGEAIEAHVVVLLRRG